MVGDASNAYGKVTSPLWLKRGELSGTQYTPEKGWDENKLNMFRRHIIQLGSTGVFVIYDELEGKEAVTWSYLLHTVELPMEIQELTDEVKVTGRNKAAVSLLPIFSVRQNGTGNGRYFLLCSDQLEKCDECTRKSSEIS